MLSVLVACIELLPLSSALSPRRCSLAKDLGFVQTLPAPYAAHSAQTRSFLRVRERFGRYGALAQKHVQSSCLAMSMRVAEEAEKGDASTRTGHGEQHEHKMSPKEAMKMLGTMDGTDEWQKDKVQDVLDGMEGVTGSKPLWGSVPVLFRRVSVQEVHHDAINETLRNMLLYKPSVFHEKMTWVLMRELGR